MIKGKTLVGVESWLPRTRVTTKWRLSFAFHFSVGANCTVLFYFPLYTWIRYSLPFRRSSASIQLGLPLSFFFERFLPIFQSLSSGIPNETKFEVLLTAGSCCTFVLAYICVSISRYFCRQSCTINCIKIVRRNRHLSVLRLTKWGTKWYHTENMVRAQSSLLPPSSL